MRRLAVLGSAVLMVVAAVLVTPGEVGGAAGPAAQKKPSAKKKQAVDGALWSFVATARDGKQVRFRYRAADLVLIDPDTDRVIGKSEPLAPTRSRVTLNDASAFPSVFEIVRTETAPHPVWKGTATFQGREWTIVLRGLLN